MQGHELLTNLQDMINGNGSHITVFGSTDLTGNSQLGGDWTLESPTNLNAGDVYFQSSAISQWDHVLPIFGVNIGFTSGADQNVIEDSGAHTAMNWATNMVWDSPDLHDFFIFTTNEAAFTQRPFIDPDTGTLTYTLAPDAYGQVGVGVYQRDTVGVSDLHNFNINITSVNDAPVFVKGADIVWPNDLNPISIPYWGSSMTAGANESTQSLTVTIGNDNPDLFTVQPYVGLDGTLHYTLADNAVDTALVTLTLHDNGGTDNGGVDTTVETFHIGALPSDANHPPSFTVGADQYVSEDGGLFVIDNWATNITTGPANESDQTVDFIVSTNNNALFSVLPSIDATGRLTYALAPDANGTATVTVQIHDNGGTLPGGTSDLGLPQNFTINVAPVNDPPVFTKGPDVWVLNTSGLVTIQNWATNISGGPPDESGQAVYFVIDSISVPSMFAVEPFISPSGTLTFDPEAIVNFPLSAVITFHLEDFAGGDYRGPEQTFTINTISVPGVLPGAQQTVLEDSGSYVIPDWATIIWGSPNLHHLEVSGTSNDAAFSQLPSIDPDTGTLSYTLSGNDANGPISLFIFQLDASGLNTQEFVIDITPVNDAPDFVKGPDITLPNDVGPVDIPNWALPITAGADNETDQTVTISMTNDNPDLFSVQPYLDLDGSLHYTMADHAIGTALVTVTLQDNGGTANNGIDTFVDTFHITALPDSVNHVPTFTAGPDQTVLENAGAVVVDNWATNINVGASQESVQAVDFIVSTNNDALFSVLPSIDANGHLTYTLAPNQYGNATVTVQIHDNGGTDGGGVDTSPPQTFNIEVLFVNQPPTITAPTELYIVENSGLNSLMNWATLTGGPSNEPFQFLLTSFNLDNPDLFDQFYFDSDGSLYVRPGDDALGNSTVTLFIQDTGGTDNGGVDSTSYTFIIHVVRDNEEPSFTVGANQNVLEGSGTHTVANWAKNINPGSPLETWQTFSFVNIQTTNDSLFSVLPSVDSNGTLTYTLAPDRYGFATIFLQIQDNGATGGDNINIGQVENFDINVQNVNDAPSFTKGSDITVLEDRGYIEFNGWATNVTPGPFESLEQSVIYTTTNNNPSLFTSVGQPFVDYNGQLNFDPAPNAFGTATITVQIRDDGGTLNGGINVGATQTFVINVLPVNDIPTFSMGREFIVLEDSPSPPVAWAAQMNAGATNEAGQTMDFIVTNNNPGLFSEQPWISSDGKLHYTLAPNQNGDALVSVSIHDSGGTTNGGVDTSVPVTFNINSTPVNDAPTFTNGGDQTFLAVSADESVYMPHWASNISSGPADEAWQSVNFSITTNNPGLFLVLPSLDAQGNLSYVLKPNVFGDAVVTVTAHDDGGVALRGIDTSQQTFMVHIGQSGNAVLVTPPVAISNATNAIEAVKDTAPVKTSSAAAQAAAPTLSEGNLHAIKEASTEGKANESNFSAFSLSNYARPAGEHLSLFSLPFNIQSEAQKTQETGTMAEKYMMHDLNLTKVHMEEKPIKAGGFAMSVAVMFTDVSYSSILSMGSAGASAQLPMAKIIMKPVTTLSQPTTWAEGGNLVLPIVLSKQPTANVIIHLSTSNRELGMPSTSWVEFTPANWNIPQEVIIVGKGGSGGYLTTDGKVIGGEEYQINTLPAVSSDITYREMTTDPVLVKAIEAPR